MRTICFLASSNEFKIEFRRCCKWYKRLSLYVAWIGDPSNIIPFDYINSSLEVNAVVGIAFYQSHPKGIKLLMDLTADVRIAKKKPLYHPKVYVFSNENKKAVFIGSSNFTYQGFCQNFEANVLIEGKDNEFENFERGLKKWESDSFSFKPDSVWLRKYTDLYNKRRQKIKQAGLDDEVELDEEASMSSAWLAIADWEIYLRNVRKGLKNHLKKYGEDLAYKLDLFAEYEQELKFPWKKEYFESIAKRRMLLGIKRYGWLGHVGASGNFQHILANGSSEEHNMIVKAINNIISLKEPLNWTQVKNQIKDLISLGPSMKVWGRFLAIVRPDLFCTISSPRVRKNISKLLGKSEKYLENVDGYLMLIRLIHSSPWYGSKRPSNKNELEIWKRRVAFLDVVFYD
jgi:hypothetical protein